MAVSKNNGTPKSSILIGFSIINHPFWGFPPIFGNTHIVTCSCERRCRRSPLGRPSVPSARWTWVCVAAHGCGCIVLSSINSVPVGKKLCIMIRYNKQSRFKMVHMGGGLFFQLKMQSPKVWNLLRTYSIRQLQPLPISKWLDRVHIQTAQNSDPARPPMRKRHVADVTCTTCTCIYVIYNGYTKYLYIYNCQC